MGLSRRKLSILLKIIDAFIILFSGILSWFILEYYVNIQFKSYLLFSCLTILCYIVFGSVFRIFSKINRYTTHRDLFDIASVLLLSVFVSSFFSYLFFQMESLRFPVLVFLFCAEFLSLSRIVWRMITERRRKANYHFPRNERHILVIGAGEGGRKFISSILEQRTDIDIIGILDDDPAKKEGYLNNIPILGTMEDLAKILRQTAVDEIIVAIPTLSPDRFELILEIANQFETPVKKMPPIEDVMLGKYSVSSYIDVEITDLLGREEVELDTSSIHDYIEGKTILITGAGGSIGSELVRQVSRFAPQRILLLGHGENSIYNIYHEALRYHSGSVEFCPIIADIQDETRIRSIFARYRPQIVFHAAAHKHVPMMQINPSEAIKNNVFGTRNVAQASIDYQVEKFIMISTDKANNPPNIMGASKRIAEMIVAGMNAQGKTQFAAVRFGNVLGSRGSVVPLFKRQIREGGPITITDKRMTRYFMTIPEAARLVIQAGGKAKGGELFILDMGSPVKILDLAKKLIKLSGYSEDQIEIKEIGIRPGEKLYEELLLDDETTGEKVFEKIFVGKVHNKPLEEVWTFIDSLDLSKEDNLVEELITYVKRLSWGKRFLLEGGNNENVADGFFSPDDRMRSEGNTGLPVCSSENGGRSGSEAFGYDRG